MKLFKKVLLNLFKIVLATIATIVSFVIDMLILLEDILDRLRTKLHPKPSVNCDVYLNELREEYKKETSRKGVVVD